MMEMQFSNLEDLHAQIVSRELRDTRMRLDRAVGVCHNDTGFPDITLSWESPLDGRVIEKKIATPWALRQFGADVIQIPARVLTDKFYTKEMRTQVLAHRLPACTDRKFLVREQRIPDASVPSGADGYGVRAFLSGESYKTSHGYQLIDHHQPLEFLMASEVAEGRKCTAFLDHDNFRIRVVDDKPMNVRGQDLDFGIDIRNGETGKSGLRVRCFLERVVCRNGLVIRAMNIQDLVKHSGRPETVQKRFQTVLDKTIERIEHLPALIEKAMTIRVRKPETLRDQLDTVAKNMAIPKRDWDEIEDEYKRNPAPPKDGEESLWDLVQAFTSYANSQDTERQMEVQDLAGDLLLFPATYDLAIVH